MSIAKSSNATTTPSFNHSQNASSSIPRITVTANTPLLHTHHLGNNNAYNQYACIRCRRLKKKCSKELPQCANCAKQNESCEYVERKNKRKSSPTLSLNGKKLRASISSTNITTTNTTTTTTTASNSANSSAPSSHSNSLSSLSDSEREIPYLISPSTSSLPQFQLPPLVKSDYPQASSLSSYSLQQPSNQIPLPSLPMQIYNIPHQNINIIQPNPSNSHYLDLSILPQQSSTSRDRSNSKSSLRSLSPTSQSPSNDYNSNIIFQHAPHNSIQFELLSLISNKINLLDNNIISINFDLDINNIPLFEDQFFELFDFITFIDKKLMIPLLEDFKLKKFNWNSINQSNSDYFNSIEFLLLLTCSLLKISMQSTLDPYYYKFTFTMANKFINRKSFKLTNIQILRIATLLQLVAFFSNSELDIISFIQTFLTTYSLKWKLNNNLKKNLNGVTLTDIEYANRLFWCIYIFDTYISSTTSEQSGFQINNINVQNPLAIVKDEEITIKNQIIIINLLKIQSKILNQLYTINSSDLSLINNSNRFTTLSLLRQDADLWYNDCRILLSKFSEENSNSNLMIEKLQNFAAWVSQEYYYTLITLFKPSIMFPNPDSPNFTVISNATFQNTQLLNDLLCKNKTPLSLPFFARYSITSLYALLSLYKGTFTISESTSLIKNMLQIWSRGKTQFTKNCYSCLSNLNKISILANPNLHFKNDEIYLPIDSSAQVVKDSINHFINLMQTNGVNVEIDQNYINNLV